MKLEELRVYQMSMEIGEEVWNIVYFQTRDYAIIIKYILAHSRQKMAF